MSAVLVLMFISGAMMLGLAVGEARGRQVNALERKALAALRDHVREQVDFARSRIEDGHALGRNVWRIALEDVEREGRALLNRLGLNR